MAAAATARKAQAQPASPRRPRKAGRLERPRGRSGQAQAARMMRPAVAGAALLPQAAVRSAGAVRDISDSSLIMRLTRGRSWIAVLCTLLGGIVALNVVSLSLSSGAGRLSLQIDDLKTQISALHAQIDERLSASKVQAEAARLGLAVPNPKAITYLSANDGDARRLAHLLATDGFLLAPSLPSSYPSDGASYAPVPVSEAPPETATLAPTAAEPTTTTGTSSTGAAPSSGSSTSGTSAGTAPSSGTTGSPTGGVGL
jgi:hypothetical protein